MKKRGQVTIFIILAIILILIASAYFLFLKSPNSQNDSPNNSSQAHICTTKEKQNQVCTMEYIGVCGNNNKTYSNGCTACSSGVYSWTIGQC